MKSIFLISGLGADERAFRNLSIPNYNGTHIQWCIPAKNETIKSYASRLINQISEPRPILIGLSFGGIIAIEIGKIIETEKIILISSAQLKNDIPFYFRFAGRLGIHRLFPVSFYKLLNPFTYWAFGVKRMEEKKLLKSFLRDTDSTFLKWAIHAIVKWENKIRLSNVIKIHGTQDRILPITTADYQIEKGGHLMIINKHKEINQILNSLVNG